jgi:hypothetical protein
VGNTIVGDGIAVATSTCEVGVLAADSSVAVTGTEVAACSAEMPGSEHASVIKIRQTRTGNFD